MSFGGSGGGSSSISGASDVVLSNPANGNVLGYNGSTLKWNNNALTKADVGLTNVDNTSDATKNSDNATLTNKTISGSTNTVDVRDDKFFVSRTNDATVKVRFLPSASQATSTTASLTLPTANGNATLVSTSATQTLTNKTIDGTGNTISNLAVSMFAGAAVVTQAEGLASSNNDTSIPTTAAVKAYADSVGSGGGSLPSQSGQSGKLLTTNGTAASWVQQAVGTVYMTGSTNLAINGDCEAAATEWSEIDGAAGVATGVRSTSANHSGTYGYRVSWTTTSTWEGGAQYDLDGATTGEEYTISVWVRSSVTKNFQIRALYRDSGAAVIETDSGSNVSCAANTWTQVTLTTTCATAGADWVTVQILIPDAGIASGATVDFDDLQILAAPEDPARPDAGTVLWIGGTVEPLNMLDGDIWYSEA